MNHKKALVPVAALLSLIPSALAQGLVLSPLTDAFRNVINFIFIDLSASLGQTVFMRFLIALLLFTVFYAVLMNLPFKKSPFAKKNIALPIAAILAIISAIFIPPQFLDMIGYAYGFTSSFLLLAIPVVAVMIATYKIFPTSKEKAPDAGTRRINHGIKAVVFYFLATLVNNYINVSVAGGTPIAQQTWGSNWINLADLVIAACMFLFIYHLIMAIFTSSSGESQRAEGEGWFESMLRSEREPAAAQGGMPAGGEETATSESGADLTPIVEKISGLRERVNSYEAGARQFLNDASILRNAGDDAFAEQRQQFLDNAVQLRTLAAQIEAAANGIADMTELFQNLRNEHIVQLADIVRRYRVANEMIIDGIIAASG